ncbi:MAG: response regulator [Treponema sp.]|jgi:putative two-component system response regulator|nr:response regulator [Treponema sp.]
MDSQRKTILVVDDDQVHLTAGKNILKGMYNVFPVPSGEKLFEILDKVSPDMILLDIEMPEMNGYEVIKKLKNTPKTEDIPVIFLSAKIDPNHELEGLGLGAVDYIYKPFSPILLIRRIETHLLLSFQKKELKRYNESLQTMVLERTEQVVELQNSVMNAIAELVECRDDESGGHIIRTQKYLEILLDRLISEKIYEDDIAAWNLAFLIQASQLHDVGKLNVNQNILGKPGRLSAEEFELVKNHALWGAAIIEKVEKQINEHTFLYHAKIFAASHHEKWDGSGYPSGLKGEAIPLQGRLMAIADVYDALISKLPYKSPVPPGEAREIILSEKGRHFDPVLVDVFDSLSGKFAEIAEITI